MLESQALLKLLQLASPVLPVGAFSYSEGLETLVARTELQGPAQLHHWLVQELMQGGVRLEAAVMVRAHRAFTTADFAALDQWNSWLSAARENEELRLQSWQMGRSLLRLVRQICPETGPAATAIGGPCNFSVAFGLTAAYWQIGLEPSLLAYLQSWATNLVNSAVKLVPLGQTAGQQLLLELYPSIIGAAKAVLPLTDDQLESSGWGLSLASMQHETLYTRLFRS